jgi:DNA-binding PadR family transcriptional regulator
MTKVEMLVLTMVHQQRGNGYAVTIFHALRELVGPLPDLAEVWTALDRLEQQGLVSSHITEGTPERGGRPKRCYRMEEAGLRALRASGSPSSPRPISALTVMLPA